MEPYRILDTRLGTGAPAAPLGPGATIDVQIAGVGPVPADAVGVVLNITGTRTTAGTYITAWPTGGVQPTASVLNLTPGIDAPNGVTALLGEGGKLSLFNFTGSTDLIADVAGYLVAGGGAPGPAGPQGPAGPGPIRISQSVAQGPAGPPITSLSGLTITPWCETNWAILTFGTPSGGNLLRMGGVGVMATGASTTVTRVLDADGVSGTQLSQANPKGALHYTGLIQNISVGQTYQLELHMSATNPCKVWGSAIPVS